MLFILSSNSFLSPNCPIKFIAFTPEIHDYTSISSSTVNSKYYLLLKSQDTVMEVTLQVDDCFIRVGD